MTKDEFVEVMNKAIEKYADLGDWVEDCQFPYTCYTECYCQRMRETDRTSQKVTIIEIKDGIPFRFLRGEAK